MRRTFAALTAGLLTLTLTACGGSGGGDVATTTAASATAASSTKGAQAESGIALEGATMRAKAAKDAVDGSDMTSIFGTIRNNTDRDVELTGFSTSLGDARYEIHEVVDGVMRAKSGGISIAAHGSYELKPGNDHLMIMDYAPEIPAGETVEVTLAFADGTEIVVPDVAVRTMLPGHESYGEGGDLQGHQHGAGEHGAGEHAH